MFSLNTILNVELSRESKTAEFLWLRRGSGKVRGILRMRRALIAVVGPQDFGKLLHIVDCIIEPPQYRTVLGVQDIGVLVYMSVFGYKTPTWKYKSYLTSKRTSLSFVSNNDIFEINFP